MVTSFNIACALDLRLQAWIDEERRLFNLSADFVDGRPITDAEWEARCRETGDLFRKIVAFPVTSMADLIAKARYVARMHEDCDEPLSALTVDEIDDETIPLLIVRDLLALGDTARAWSRPRGTFARFAL